MRIPKDAFLRIRSCGTAGWMSKIRLPHHIVGHWNYEPGVKKPIYVVSSGDKVELFVNGQSKGFGEQSKRFLFTWKEIPFEAGEIKAVSLDAAGKKLSEAVIKTAGAAVAIKLSSRTAPGAGWPPMAPTWRSLMSRWWMPRGTAARRHSIL